MDAQPNLQPAPVPARKLVPVGPDVSLATYHWTGGTLRPFVLLHGLASNARLWDGVAASLAQLGHPVVSIDQRGHGQSSKPDYGYDFTTITDDLAALLDALGLDAPVLSGQSWGGNVVVEFAARFPGRASGIVPLDGGFISLAEKFPTWEECEAQLAPPRFAGTPAAQFENWIRDAHPEWPAGGVQGVMANVDVRADGTVAPWLTFERHMLILRALYAHQPVERCRVITDPVLWVVARSDAAWTADKRRGVQAAHGVLQRSRVEWIQGDHDLHAQYPEQVAAMLHEAAGGFFA
jgi:pimeloyl-ACP methyl ester carboxylesterase